MRIRKGDLVKVICGSKAVKGLQGKVASVDYESQRIVIEGAPLNKRHLKPERSRKHPEGGIINVPSSIHVSNVMLVSESLSRPVRIGYKIEDGKKIRVAKGKGISGQSL